MHMSNGIRIRCRVALLLVASGGTLLASACSLKDLRLNVVSGTLGFIEGYTQDAWAAVVPSAESIFGRDSDE